MNWCAPPKVTLMYQRTAVTAATSTSDTASGSAFFASHIIRSPGPPSVLIIKEFGQRSDPDQSVSCLLGKCPTSDRMTMRVCCGTRVWKWPEAAQLACRLLRDKRDCRK